MSVWVSPLAFVLYLLALAHGVFAWNIRGLRPELDILGPPPSSAVRQAVSFGDAQVLYRFWALDLQNAGDTGGRATPMRDYNYDYVLGWLTALRELDGRGQFHLFLAAHYFSQTPNLDDVRRIVEFIRVDAAKNPNEKWYWLTQAIATAQLRLNDLPYALSLSLELAGYDPPSAPRWVLMFPAVLLEKMGRFVEAKTAIERVRTQRWNDLREDERLWLEDFTQRLQRPAAQER